MKMFLFRSVKERSLFGFSDDPRGENLPDGDGPWQSAQPGTAAASYSGSSLDELAISDPVMSAVKRKGFYLAWSGLKDTPRLYIFRSTQMTELYAFTVDATGANLPPEKGSWKPAGDSIPLGATMASTAPGIAKEVTSFGYALVKGHSVSQPHVHRTESEP